MDNRKPSEFVIKCIKRSNQDILKQKLEKTEMGWINNFIVNIKRNDDDSSDYIFKLIEQIDLTEKLKKSYAKDLGDFIWNISEDPLLSGKYSQIINSFELTGKIIRSPLKDSNHFLWTLFQISKELPNIFSDKKILLNGLNRKKEYLFSLNPYHKQYLKDGDVNDNLKKEFEGNKLFLSSKVKISERDEKQWVVAVDGNIRYIIEDTGTRLNVYETGVGEKLCLIGIFRSANASLTNSIVRMKTSELQSEITRSEAEFKNWLEKFIDSPERNPFKVALALKGAVDANWIFPFIRANFDVESVIKCLEDAETKNEKSESLINGILRWLNEAKSKAFADIDRAESYYWEGETYLRLKKFDAAKKSFSEAEELFLNLNNRERAFDAAYRHIYVYILEEEEKEWIDYESYFNFLEGFLERYKDLTIKEYQIHEKRIDYYKNKAKYFFYNKRDFDTACKFSKEAYEYAERISKKYPTDDFKRVIPLNRAFYWRAKANLLKIGRLPDHHKIAEYYEEAAQNSEKREKYMDLANCYKHKAIAFNKEINPEKFFESIAKSIEFETKLGVEEVKTYLENLRKEDLLVFPYIENLAKSMDDFLEIAKEHDKIWEFLSLIIQSEKTIYYYREGNKDTSKVSRAAYEYAKELYEKYPSEDIECLISLNEAFYWRATAELLKDEPLKRYRLIANSYKKAAQASEKYDEKESYKDWAERYKYEAFVSRNEPEKYLENISKAIEFAVKVGVKIAQDFKRLKQEYIHSRSAVQNYFKDRNFEKTRKFSREIFEYVEKTWDQFLLGHNIHFREIRNKS